MFLYKCKIELFFACLCVLYFLITLFSYCWFKIFNATEELQKASNYPDVRIFTAAMEYSAVPLSDLAGIEEYWSLPSNGKY